MTTTTPTRIRWIVATEYINGGGSITHHTTDYEAREDYIDRVIRSRGFDRVTRITLSERADGITTLLSETINR